MKIIWRLILLGVVAAAAVWLWTSFFPDPQQVIRKQLATVAREVSVKPNQSPLVTVGNAHRLANSFSTNVQVRLEVPGGGEHAFTSREEIVQAATAALAAIHGLKVQFLDVNVTLGPDRQSAVADLTLKAERPGDPELNVQEMKFTFQKIGGHWLITRVETVRTLS